MTNEKLKPGQYEVILGLEQIADGALKLLHSKPGNVPNWAGTLTSNLIQGINRDLKQRSESSQEQGLSNVLNKIIEALETFWSAVVLGMTKFSEELS